MLPDLVIQSSEFLYLFSLHDGIAINISSILEISSRL